MSSAGSRRDSVEGGGEPQSPSDGGARPPARIPGCPWCNVEIQEGEAMGIVHGVRYHAGCAEDMLVRDVELETMFNDDGTPQ